MPKARPKQQPNRKPSLNAGLDATAVLAWYDHNARILAWRISPHDRQCGRKPDPYRVWLSEVMLQQTTVAAVAKYYARFTALWPTVADLAAAPIEAVLVEWAGLGYYARARNLHACARAVAERHSGNFPTDSATLLTLPGIGPYTAAAIAAICADEPIAVVDGNVDRVAARVLALDTPVREAKDKIRALVQDAVPARAGDFAQALMDIGATICAPRVAMCGLCPLRPDCRGAELNPPDFPVKPARAGRPTRFGHAFVILDAAGDVYLETRAEKGLLGQMTGTPTSDWGAETRAAEFPFKGKWRTHGQVMHVFTHFRLELEVWSATASDVAKLDGGWWADRRTLAAEALPSLFRKVLAAAGLE